MQWQVLYDQKHDVLYNGYEVGGSHSRNTYDNAYCGPRIAEYLAIGSGKVPGALWWGPHRTPPASHNQRQVPRGWSETYLDPQNHHAYRATSPGTDMRYRNYGVPALSIDQGPVAHAVVTPYAAFLALPVIPGQAAADISRMAGTYPSLYTRYGFLDSVTIRSGQVAARYLAVSQLTILMSISSRRMPPPAPTS
jgi:hypothetical protein